jgi:hypothetical protein
LLAVGWSDVAAVPVAAGPHPSQPNPARQYSADTSHPTNTHGPPNLRRDIRQTTAPTHPRHANQHTSPPRSQIRVSIARITRAEIIVIDENSRLDSKRKPSNSKPSGMVMRRPSAERRSADSWCARSSRSPSQVHAIRCYDKSQLCDPLPARAAARRWRVSWPKTLSQILDAFLTRSSDLWLTMAGSASRRPAAR